MVLTFVRGLLMYRLPVILAATAASFIGLVRGLSATTVLTQNVWPSPLREHAMVLLAISTLLSIGLVYVIRARQARAIPGLAAFVLVALMAAFGFSSVVGALTVIAACFVVGHFIEVTLGRGFNLVIVDTSVVGLAALMLLLTLVAALQIHMVLALWGIMFFCACYILMNVSLRTRFRNYMMCLYKLSWPNRRPPWVWCIPLTLGVFSILFIAAQTALPERYFDALTFHLLVPSQMLTFGRMNLDPQESAFAVAPVAINYIYTFAYLLGGEMAARLFNLFVLFAILLQIAAIVRPLYGRSAAGFAILLFLSIPTVLIVTASLFIENTLALLTITAVRLVLQQNSKAYCSALTGLMFTLGALCAAKLHGVFVSFPIAAAALFSQDYCRLNRADWRRILFVGLACLVLGATPYAVSWIKTGNPIFPFQNAFFKSPYWPATNFEDTRWTGRFSPFLLYRMTFISSDFLEAGHGAMGFAFAALLLPGMIVGLLRPQREIILCLAVSAAFALITMSQIQYIRYLYAVFPLMVVVCIAAVSQLAAVRAWRPLIYAATVVVAAFGVYKLPSSGWVLQYTNIAAVFDTEQKIALVRAQVPVRLANEMINAVADKPRVLYATQTAYGAFLKGTPIYAAWYSHALMADLNAAQTIGEIKVSIERQRADYIVVEMPAPTTHHAKILTYAKEYADYVATIGPLSIYKIKSK
jgi:hypothetical protein